jgi:hypothetical protein
MGTVRDFEVIDAHAHVIEHLAGYGRRGKMRAIGAKPIVTFTAVVLVNLVLGCILANLLFGEILAKPLG